MRILLACAFVFLSTLTGSSQQGKISIKRTPGDFAKWTLTIKEGKKSRSEQKAEEEAAAEAEVAVEQTSDEDRVRKTEYEITGTTGRATTTEGQTKKEIYLHRYKTNMLMLRYDEGLQRVRPYLFDQYAAPEMRFAITYPGIDWVEPKYYKGIVKKQGQNCHHFLQEANTGSQEALNKDDELAYDPRFTVVTREAWFSVDTGLPVGFESGNTEGVFRHEKPSTKPIKLPKKYMDTVLYYYGRGPRPVEGSQ
jgi:hypothetical protein